MSSQRFFIAIDFSDASYRALQYATVLAKELSASLNLFHVIDADKMTVSDNPLVVSRSIAQLTTKAKSRMHSFSEMITDSFNVSVEHTIAIGDPELVLTREIEKNNSDIVFFGRMNPTSPLIKSMLAKLACPVIVVPAESKIKVPERVLFATDLRPVHPTLLAPLLIQSNYFKLRLSLLHIERKGAYLNGAKKNLVQEFDQQFKGNVDFVSEVNKEPLVGVLNHTQTECVDLLCAIKRKKSFFQTLFSKGFSYHLAMQSASPVMILAEAS